MILFFIAMLFVMSIFDDEQVRWRFAIFLFLPHEYRHVVFGSKFLYVLCMEKK